MVITSTSNERIKNIAKLQIKKYRDEERKFLVEGDHLVNEAYESGYLEEVFILDGANYSFDNVNVNYVSEEVLKKLSDQISSTDIIGVCKFIDIKELNNNLILLDKIQDPGNLGTIIRSAAAFNYDVVIGDNSVDIYNSKTIRSTEGMIFHVNFIKTNLINFINNNRNYKYLIADMNNGTNVKKLNITGKHALIMGNEGNGVSDDIRNLGLDYVYINQNNKCESLNVGVASSILMHELGDVDE